MRPTQILAKMCKDEALDGPHYSTGRVRIDNKVFGATSQVLEESGTLAHFRWFGRARHVSTHPSSLTFSLRRIYFLGVGGVGWGRGVVVVSRDPSFE